jgi:hypothetical protein
MMGDQSCSDRNEGLYFKGSLHGSSAYSHEKEANLEDFMHESLDWGRWKYSLEMSIPATLVGRNN